MKVSVALLLTGIFITSLIYPIVFYLLPTALSFGNVMGAVVFTFALLLGLTGFIFFILSLSSVIVQLSEIVTFSLTRRTGTGYPHRLSITVDARLLKLLHIRPTRLARVRRVTRQH